MGWGLCLNKEVGALCYLFPYEYSNICLSWYLMGFGWQARMGRLTDKDNKRLAYCSNIVDNILKARNPLKSEWGF